MLFRKLIFRYGKNIYNDATELSESEISQILHKQPKAQDNLSNTKQEYHSPNYDKDITQIIKDVQSEAASRWKAVENTPIEPTPTPLEAKHYKYGLPIPNLPIDLVPKKIEPPKTITQSIFEVFNLNEHTSYQEYEKAIAPMREGMYGSIKSNTEERNAMKQHLQEGAIPRAFLMNQKYMEEIRSLRTLNLTIPGSIENEHPHRFLKLRPVEEFRHTPLIPISQRQMNEFQEQLRAYHRKGFYLEVTREQILSYLFFGGLGFVLFSLLRMVLKMEEEQGLQFQRLKLRRMGMAYDLV